MPALGLDLALLAGPALDPGAPRFGSMLRGFARPFDAADRGAAVAARRARASRRRELLFVGGSAGLLLRLQAPGSAFARRSAQRAGRATNVRAARTTRRPARTRAAARGASAGSSAWRLTWR